MILDELPRIVDLIRVRRRGERLRHEVIGEESDGRDESVELIGRRALVRRSLHRLRRAFRRWRHIGGLCGRLTVTGGQCRHDGSGQHGLQGNIEECSRHLGCLCLGLWAKLHAPWLTAACLRPGRPACRSPARLTSQKPAMRP